ncbi:hypothetical protein PR202_gb13394 [Eleusine coracana subsp. coracana]|uniref:Uncharacterized protein n=1 Tax=Eleusine coracana subsp. coracana TaxID=191504 RepID=A0AAV5ESJ1_ELECO|nr:hypothetical protein PR202_gb13394 [Eleusine coracana subsp. coracana]
MKLSLSYLEKGKVIRTHVLLRTKNQLIAWLQVSLAETKNLALDEILEALHTDEKSVVSMLGPDYVSAIVQLLNTWWPKTVQEKAATVVCHLARSCEAVMLLKLEDAILPLVRLAESGSVVGRQKAAVALYHLSFASPGTAFFIVSDGGVRALIEMCHLIGGGDSVCQSGRVRRGRHAQQHLHERGDVEPASKEHAAECLENLTAGDNDDGMGLQRAVMSEGGLRTLLLYLGTNDRHEAAVRAIRNLVGVISTTSGSAGDMTTRMKRLAGEQGCVPLLVRTIQEGNSNSARKVAVQMLAKLATYAPNAMEMSEDDKCVPSLVKLVEPTQAITAITQAIQCLLLLVSTSDKRCRNLMISHGAKGHLRKLSDLDIQGAAEMLHRLERG